MDDDKTSNGGERDSDDKTIPFSFIPRIPTSPSNERREVERAIRGAIRASLQMPDEKCATAIAQYKCNGMKLGHKVLDNGAAWQALTETAVEPFKSTLRTTHAEISVFRRTQLLDMELRRHYEMNKQGKLTGPKSTEPTRT